MEQLSPFRSGPMGKKKGSLRRGSPVSVVII
jgi:hypothetical protein